MLASAQDPISNFRMNEGDNEINPTYTYRQNLSFTFDVAAGFTSWNPANTVVLSLVTGSRGAPVQTACQLLRYPFRVAASAGQTNFVFLEVPRVSSSSSEPSRNHMRDVDATEFWGS